MTSEKPIPFGRRVLRDIGLGLGIIGVAALLVLFNVYTKTEVSAAWVGLAGFTPLTFWIVARHYRSIWHRPSFWLTLTGLLVIHLLGFTLVLRNYPAWRMLWYAPVLIIEVMLIGLVIEIVVAHHRV